MKHSILLAFFLSAFFIATSFSQEKKSEDEGYKTGIGLRGGWLGGLTAKHFIKEGRALEGIFSSGWGWRGYQITVLYEIHKPAFTKDDVKGFAWFYGGGAHFGGYRYNIYTPVWHQTGPSTGFYTNEKHGYTYTAFGIDAIFGLEYKIDEVPFTIGLDIKPFIEFTNDHYYPMRFWDGAFTIRYVF